MPSLSLARTRAWKLGNLRGTRLLVNDGRNALVPMIAGCATIVAPRSFDQPGRVRLTMGQPQVHCSLTCAAVTPPRMRACGVHLFHRPWEEHPMFDYRDLFQLERFITPSIIKIFYWLAVAISGLFGLSGIISGLALMSLHPLAGLFWILGSMIGIVIGIIFARIVSEFFLIMFRINEHLGAIRQRGQM